MADEAKKNGFSQRMPQKSISSDGSLAGDGSVACAFSLSALKVVFGASLYPSPGILGVVKTDGANGSCRVTLLASFRAGGVLAQQAACSLFMNVYHIVLFFVFIITAKIRFIS